MARIRTIKPEFPQSESMGRLSREARLCFVLLWTILDDEGRARGSSRMLASLLYPYDDDAPKLIDGWLEELEGEGCIIRYEVDGNSYLASTNWLKHQKIDKPSKSRLPPPTDNSRKVAKPREASAPDLVPSILDLDLGSGPSSSLRSDVSADADSSPIVDDPPSKPFVEPKPDAPELFDIPPSLDRRTKPPPDDPDAKRARGAAMLTEAHAAYNAAAETAGWPKAQVLTTARGAALARRLTEVGGIAGWHAAMAKALDSPFLRGETGRDGAHANWRPDLDFFLKPKNFTKLMEGGYDRTDRAAQDRAGNGACGRLGSIAQAAAFAMANGPDSGAQSAGLPGEILVHDAA